MMPKAKTKGSQKRVGGSNGNLNACRWRVDRDAKKKRGKRDADIRMKKGKRDVRTEKLGSYNRKLTSQDRRKLLRLQGENMIKTC